MVGPILLGAGLGAVAGAATGSTSLLTWGAAFWAPTLAAVGAAQGWIGWWILKQSGDLPKMRAAVPLSGPVLASVVCVFSGEGFLLPVLASLLVGTLLGWRLTATWRG